MTQTPKTVLLTGASGFIATHILEILVKKQYNIVATVRNQDKADWIRKLFPTAPIEISFVKDIAADGAFDTTLKDHPEIDYVLHTASPFYYPTENPESVLSPALHGTQGILKAIGKYGKNVKHVVITSSFAAIRNPLETRPPTSLTYSEQSWNPLTWEDGVKNVKITYPVSKKIAEKAFWDFIEAEKPAWRATTVNPPYVWGPVLHKIDSIDQINTSNAIIDKLAHAKTLEEVNKGLGIDMTTLWVDVRDVAAAHVIAIEKEEASDGKRFFVTPGYTSTREVLKVLNDNIPELKGKVYNDGKPVPTAEDIAKERPRLDNSATAKETGIKYISLTKSIVDTYESLKSLHEKLD